MPNNHLSFFSPPSFNHKSLFCIISVRNSVNNLREKIHNLIRRYSPYLLSPILNPLFVLYLWFSIKSSPLVNNIYNSPSPQ